MVPFIPNYSDATFPDMAEPDSVDFEILLAGARGDGVLSGCAVTSSAVGALDPSDIAGLVGWYDFSDITMLWQDDARTTQITADAQTIAGVTDKSGTGNHIAQSGGSSACPLYKTAIQNGLSIARFQGDDWLVGSMASTQPYTVFVVGSVTDPTVNQYFVDGESNNKGVVRNANNTAVGLYAGAVLDATVTAATMTSFHVIAAIFDGATSTVAFDGATTDGDGGTVNTTSLTVGRGGSSVAPVTGDIAELVFYDSALVTDDREGLEAYFRDKWATP